MWERKRKKNSYKELCEGRQKERKMLQRNEQKIKNKKRGPNPA